MRPASGMVFLAAMILVAWDLSAQVFDPHGDSQNGVLRVATDPPTRGQCVQCHPVHADSWSASFNPELLFAENDNRIAFWSAGDGPCHASRPDNYPLAEDDRLPDTEPDPGYFEANVGGIRRPGVEFRGRWPGEQVYTDPAVSPEGRHYSPHAQDPDMPRRSAAGEGLCLNCHNPHGTPNLRDLLVAPYAGIGGHDAIGAPEEYRLCFTCHGHDGPVGMEIENRFIEDYYDRGLNGESAGHQIRKNPQVAIFWPAHIQVGDMLPCYDCHNPHGSEGRNGVEPNAFLLSDQRRGWSGLTDTLNDAEQCRRFCLGCHIPSDGAPGTKEVEGILMNTLSDRGPHRSTGFQSCNNCHGGSYDEPTSNNIHNPGDPN